MNLWRKIIIKLLARLTYKLYRLRTKNINYHSLSGKRASNPDYRINNFKDILFNVDSQKRENIAILKLLRSPHLWFLCNDTYSWVAVNIPLNLCGGNFKGDIDILIAMVIFPPREGTDVEKIYRLFEVKTTKINRNGVVKSLKSSKFGGTKKQLNKLIRAGSQQTFLLEIFVLEADYSLKFNQLPSFVTSFINKNISQIKKKREIFGYNCIFLEQQRGFDEEKMGIYHHPMCLKGAPIKEPKSPIKDIVERLEDYWEKEKEKYKKPTFITYCKKCKKLNIISMEDMAPKCGYCKRDIF